MSLQIQQNKKIKLKNKNQWPSNFVFPCIYLFIYFNLETHCKLCDKALLKILWGTS